jgi:RNA polymerase sigma factor (sigma-70 family)
LPTPSEDFADIVRAHQAMVFRVLTRMVGTQDVVEDLAQEVFLRLYRALPHFQKRSRLSTYLYRIVINVAQDEWKRRRGPSSRTQSLSDPAARWEDRLPHPAMRADRAVERQELWHAVEQCLPALGESERAALVLYHQEGRSYEEIARILELPIGTIRTHLHRGREKLACLVRERMQRS